MLDRVRQKRENRGQKTDERRETSEWRNGVSVKRRMPLDNDTNVLNALSDINERNGVNEITNYLITKLRGS